MKQLAQFFLSYRLRALLRKEFAQIRRDRRLAMSLILPPTLQLLLFGFALNANADGIAFFEKNIRPLLAEHCYQCHSSKLNPPMGGLLLDSQAGMLRGGKSGSPVIVAGKPDDSLLIAAVRRVNKDLQMPPGKALEESEISNLVEWIKMGAPDPRTEAAPVVSLPAPSYDWDKARRHWAFRPVRDPKIPYVAAPEWCSGRYGAIALPRAVMLYVAVQAGG